MCRRGGGKEGHPDNVTTQGWEEGVQIRGTSDIRDLTGEYETGDESRDQTEASAVHEKELLKVSEQCSLPGRLEDAYG